MAQNNKTKKQHYLPQFYLKRFADSKGFLHFYDKKNDRLSPARHYSSVGYKRYFYAAETGVSDEVSQQIEEWLKTYEGIISQELIKIIDKILNFNPISEDDKYILASLMCMLWLRTPNMRYGLNQMHEDIFKQIMKFGADWSVDNFIRKTGINATTDERRSLINMLEKGEYGMHFNNISHLRFMTETFGFNDKGFTNMFYGQKWKIYINKGKRKFITSENPVVEWWSPPKSFYDNATFLERTKYFPLTPEIFIILTYPRGSNKANRKTLYDEQEELVKELNLLLASRKGDFVYSDSKVLLEEIISSRRNPGLFERDVYKKYDQPWDEYRKDNL